MFRESSTMAVTTRASSEMPSWVKEHTASNDATRHRRNHSRKQHRENHAANDPVERKVNVVTHPHAKREDEQLNHGARHKKDLANWNGKMRQTA